MVWTATTDIDQYAARAEPWLLRNAVRNNVLLTIIEHARRGTATWDAGSELYAWHETDGTVDGAASHTPPSRLLLPDLAVDLVESVPPSRRTSR
ncbi:MAG: hypothetical protein WCJ30_18225 [Deltaproteobacteria bacterium]